MVSSADAYYAYDPTSAPISPQGGYFHYSIQLLSKLADQSCAELGTPDVQLPSDIFNCSVTHEPSWVSPRAPVYSNIPEAIWGASAKVSGSPVYLLQAPEVIWVLGGI